MRNQFEMEHSIEETNVVLSVAEERKKYKLSLLERLAAWISGVFGMGFPR